MPSPQRCPFCNPPQDSIVRESEFGLVIRDGFPVAAGHLLVIPRRHVASFFELDPLEQADLLNLIVSAQRLIRDQVQPDGLNVGLNEGAAAGQTVEHCHWHLIPRHEGDVPDPRGGVRWVVPDRAAYWNSGV